MPEALYVVSLLILLGALVVLIVQVTLQTRTLRGLPAQFAEMLEQKHRTMLVDLYDGLARQSDRIGSSLNDSSERLRVAVADELKQTREAVYALQLALGQNLSENREAMLAKLTDTTQTLTWKIDERLEQISGRVTERLDDGFRKTNETFVNVMTRLATIDEAQKKIETLTGSVVSLQELLGDKRSRGAFGEVQLGALVRNILPPSAFELQYTLSNGTRVDCVLKLPDPTGMVCVDSKFPLENYHKMLAAGVNDVERAPAKRQFRADVKKHVDDIAKKYILPNETSDGAVMFVPAEAVFAEIHAYHADVVAYALQRRVWIVSPTTLMAVLNTARAVLKDLETRKQIHIIKDELGKLGKDFARFDERMHKLADHVRQAHEDAQQVQISSRKISDRFASIERVELEETERASSRAVELDNDSREGA